jgi:D-beta-D-heptose 7-phosphate kinase/D-beta-D-heptose 1-phosphate adenosyltransferase
MRIAKSDAEACAIIEDWRLRGHKIYLTSGGFDPMHVGHLRCLQETAMLARGPYNTEYVPEKSGKVVVIVNGDEFLVEKKGKPFMSAPERLEIVAGVRGVDLVVEWYDGTQTVDTAIEKFRPDFFTKGGDRNSPENLPEWKTCEAIGCEVIFGVGGKKIQSSSWLVRDAKQHE